MTIDKMFDERVRMTEEDYRILSAPVYDRIMNDCIKYSVVRSLKPSELADLRGVYERLGYTLTNPSCGSCVYNMVSRLAKHYFAAMEIRVKKEIIHQDSQKAIKARNEKRKQRAIQNAKTLEKKDGSVGQPDDSGSSNELRS